MNIRKLLCFFHSQSTIYLFSFSRDLHVFSVCLHFLVPYYAGCIHFTNGLPGLNLFFYRQWPIKKKKIIVLRKFSSCFFVLFWEIYTSSEKVDFLFTFCRFYWLRCIFSKKKKQNYWDLNWQWVSNIGSSAQTYN